MLLSLCLELDTRMCVRVQGMWIYRLGLTKVKSVCLSGEPLTGKEAFEAGLINKSVPFHRLEAEVR